MITKMEIAGLNLRLDCETEELAKACGSFAYDFRCVPDGILSVSNEEIKTFQKEMGGFTRTGAGLALLEKALGETLAENNILLVRAGYCEKDGKAFLCVGEDIPEDNEFGLFAISQEENGKFFVYTTPFCVEKREKIQLGGVCASLQQGGELTKEAWLGEVFKACVCPKSDDNFCKITEIIDKIYSAELTK